jgi:threonine/homoserine/homoserine lactone efflux protein
MFESTNLLLYFFVVSGVIILPGMDMAFVMGSSMTGGRRSGLAAVAGIVAGGLCHMVIAATGISIIFKLIPAAYTTILLTGAAYIAWIGWSMIRAGSLSDSILIGGDVRKPIQSFFGAMATCLLNPKAYMFMLAIFPQFVRFDRGSIWIQAGVLSMITASIQIAVYGGLALMAAKAQTTLVARPRLNALMAKGVGLLLMMMAILTLYEGITAGLIFHDAH